MVNRQRLLLTGFVTDGIGRRHRFLVTQEHIGAPLKVTNKRHKAVL